MSFIPAEQFRCIIIRGKAITELDNFLPAYAKIITDICPCPKEQFAREFNKGIIEIIGPMDTKTVNNHRTEIAGKLFGMYYSDEHDTVFASERTEKYMEDSDQPAFFKDICFKFQFPNGMDSINTVLEKMNVHVSIRQFPYILKMLLLARESGVNLTRDEVGYYVLNSLHVLQGKVDPQHVLERIVSDRSAGIRNRVRVPGKASSYTMQHIKEQLNLLVLANLIRMDSVITLNHREMNTIKLMASYWDEAPEFDAYSYNLDTIEGRKRFYLEWQLYYAHLNTKQKFETSVSSLIQQQDSEEDGADGDTIDTNAIGEEGESFVLEYEKKRVANFDPRLVRKVVYLGKTKGLGFDIQSVVAESGDYAEFVKYIEVKTTKRVTVPNLEDASWIDTINMTRNEWVAAAQHRQYYSIYRVYLTPEKVTVYTLSDPYNKHDQAIIKCTPLSYRLDFSNRAVDNVLQKEESE
jgi:hypothetical protein